MHGGKSTGPRTEAGRKRVGTVARRLYVEAALENGWAVASESLRDEVVEVWGTLGSTRAAASELGLTRHGLRRVLARLPLRPEELSHLREWHRTLNDDS